MLFTHLSLSFLPLFISFLFSFFFIFITFFFFFNNTSLYFYFFIGFFFFCLYFFFQYSLNLKDFSFFQLFFNCQFFIFFIVSEVFFFIGVFWALFWIIYSYDSAFILSITFISPFGLALFNTLLLLLSSSYAVLFHIQHLNFFSNLSLIWCFFFGLIFLVNQYIEFFLCNFSISSFSFCSVFFFGTGFHGFHVFVGLLLIFLNIIYIYIYNQSTIFFLNCSLLYWHFVDIIWLFLFIFVYIVIFLLYVY